MAYRYVVLLGTVLSLCWGGAKAQEVEPPPSVLAFPAAAFREQYVNAIMMQLRNAAVDQKNLTADDVRRAGEVVVARRLSEVMRQFFAADIDGDRQIDASERSIVSRETIGQKQWLSEADTNTDSVVTLDEAIVFSRGTAAQEKHSSLVRQLEELLALDPDGNGVLSAAELEKLALHAYRFYDRDGDGVVSDAERDILKKERQKGKEASSLRPAPITCRLPKATAADKVYAISAYRAGTLSNVAVAGQNRTSEVIDIHIEEGSEPLYIIASSFRATIWRVTGAVQRVSWFADSGLLGSGVVGLPRDKVMKGSGRPCLDFFGPFQPEAQAHFKLIEDAVGHKLDGILFKDRIDAVSIPSQMERLNAWSAKPLEPTSVTFKLEGFPRKGIAQTSQTFKRFRANYPGGVADIDPASVVARVVAGLFDVLPREAGLLQLMQDGTLQEKGSRYVIQRPVIKLPGGWEDDGGVVFVLPPGMDRPDRIPSGTRLALEPEK